MRAPPAEVCDARELRSEIRNCWTADLVWRGLDEKGNFPKRESSVMFPEERESSLIKPCHCTQVLLNG